MLNGLATGVDPGFSRGGEANGNAWRMVVAAGRVPLKLSHVLPFVPFHSCQILLACVFRELVILMRYGYPCSMMSDSCSDVFFAC